MLYFQKPLLQVRGSSTSKAGVHRCAGLPTWWEGTLTRSAATLLTCSSTLRRALGFRYAVTTLVEAAGEHSMSPISAMGPI